MSLGHLQCTRIDQPGSVDAVDSILELNAGRWAIDAKRSFTLRCTGDVVVEVRGDGASECSMEASGTAMVQADCLGNVTVDASGAATVFVHNSRAVRVSARGSAKVRAIYVDALTSRALDSANVRGVLNSHCPCSSTGVRE